MLEPSDELIDAALRVLGVPVSRKCFRDTLREAALATREEAVQKLKSTNTTVNARPAELINQGDEADPWMPVGPNRVPDGPPAER